ncbi:MAG: helix-turn-helix transcriptional regulator [Alphaproteobacteria bacterium]
MLTIEQCRGARGLLGWTQQDLADASGLSKTAINNFEKGHSDIKAESLRAIRMAFESVEIEFLEQDGLRKRSENIRILKGPSGMSELLDDIARTNLTAGSEILINNVDNTLSSQISTQRLFEHIEMLKTGHIRQRVLCPQDTKNVLSPNDECRWISREDMGGRLASFIYANKVAFQLWDRSMIIIINSPEARLSETRRFEMLWSSAAKTQTGEKKEKNPAEKQNRI